MITGPTIPEGKGALTASPPLAESIVQGAPQVAT